MVAALRGDLAAGSSEARLARSEAVPYLRRTQAQLVGGYRIAALNRSKASPPDASERRGGKLPPPEVGDFEVRDPEALFQACVEALALSSGGDEMHPSGLGASAGGVSAAGGEDPPRSEAATRTLEVVKALATWLGPPLVPRAGTQPVNHDP